MVPGSRAGSVSIDESDGGVDDIDVSKEDLKEIMHGGDDGLKLLQEKFNSINEVVHRLKSSVTLGINGNENEINRRKAKFDSNYIPPMPPKTFLQFLFEAFKDTLLIILMVAGLVSLILGVTVEEEKSTAWIEGFAIFVSVIIVALVTAVNDYTKEQQFRGLQSKIEGEHTFTVIRGGESMSIFNGDIVVGDICQLKYGDMIPADGLLVQNNDLKIDESSLTGESDLVRKGDANPFILSGTKVMEGSGKMIVTAVGINSRSGQILKLLVSGADKAPKPVEAKIPETEDGMLLQAMQTEKKDNESGSKDEKSILQGKLTKLAVLIGWFGLGAGILTVVVTWIRFSIETYHVDKESFKNSHISDYLRAFITGVTVLVVAVPEGLPLAVTISLAFSVKKMLNDHNLVRHLDACETMGNATAICSDKTGTLTTNRMTVVQSYLGQQLYFVLDSGFEHDQIPESLRRIFAEGISYNSSYASKIEPGSREGELDRQMGNKTDCALLGFVDGPLKDHYNYYRGNVSEEEFIKVFTFNSSRKSMSTVVPIFDDQNEVTGYRIHCKGASEIVLSKCTSIIGSDGTTNPLSSKEIDNIVKNVVEPMADNGLRTICLAYKDFPKDTGQDWDDESSVVSELICLGITGIEDPVRPEVPDAIKVCQRAGVTVRMVTGDNVATARSIATKCGILTSTDEFLVMEGKQFNKRIRDENTGKVIQSKIDEIWPKLRVLARSSPEDKYNLVKGIIDSELSKTREIVAVTGDGTNDAPALKMADVGFAMGIAGTDVAKEASDIILTDDNFTSIVKAVKWGRNVYDSISKFLQFQLTVNFVAIFIAVIGALAHTESPLSATQLLWVNLIMDSFASLALATEPPTDDLLTRKPYGRTKPLISRTMAKNILLHGIYQIIVLLVLMEAGPKLFDIDPGFRNHGQPTVHFTIMFNTFVFMQLFNEINSRKVHGQRNVFEGIFNNWIFLVIWFGTVFVQVILVEFSGHAFRCKSLNAQQWMWCLLLGFTELLIGQVVATVPKTIFSKALFQLGRGSRPPPSNARHLWIRSVTRLRHQIRVVNAFRSTVEDRSLTA
ncbi:plasma membrane calcium-transporting ATPase 1-like [Xenia sp. Carnegie-2017]|uniref:plasma membrane calcium-transporting ATPase 1-like n=1 Tax=Xenia sp. Carnegie-2017 TaxID=2897299 RepID=UPI001F050308|nr:plasma membrane calcium-transporting ATPase 1-like [Xenia sp. Carnegie-2017]